MKQSKYLVFFMVLACSYVLQAQSFSTAGFYQVKNTPRKVFNFNPGWRFYKGDLKGAEKVNFDDTKWEAANIPHGLEVLGENASGGRNYQGIAWYRKQFQITNNPKTKTYLYFEAVMGKCKVWINGKIVAEHFGGYLPFTIDISKEINSDDRNNTIAVKVDNSDDTSYLPGKIQRGLDFTYMGGIYRDTYIIQTSNTHITLPELSNTVAGGGVFAGTIDVSDNTAKLEIRTEVINDSKQTSKIELVTTLEDTNFNLLKKTTKKLTLRAGKSKQMKQLLTVNDVQFWHPDNPYLHFIKTELLINGVVVDAMRTRIGIRLFEMRGKNGLYINKMPYTDKLIGVNRHQDYTFIGNALPNSGQWRDVKLLREGGSRIIRAGHYPQDPAFYDACDELGMLTTTANPGWHFFNFKSPVFEKRLYEDTRRLVRRDRNVASVLMWETALNETPKQPANAMNTMHKIAHKEYPFPGMFTVTDYQEAKKGGLDLHYHGTDPNVNSFNREYGDGNEVDNWSSQNATTRVKMEWGERALLNQALIQAATLSDRYATPKSRLGGAIWAGIDHQRGYHPDPFWGGLLNGVRLPKYVYYLYKSQYDPTYKVNGIKTGPMVFAANELTQISPKDMVFFSNCEKLKVTWLGKVIGIIKPSTDPKYRNLPHPPFIIKDAFDFSEINTNWRRKTNQIELVVEGLIGNEVVVKQHKNYAERTSGVKLNVSSEGLDLIADGSDIVPIRATIVDTDGVKKVLASSEVYFTIEGEGSLVNLNPVKTEMGVATMLVRASLKSGEIKIKAYSNGLSSSTISLKSKPANIPFLYDENYFKMSKESKNEHIISVQDSTIDLPLDVQELHKEIENLRLVITGQEQELMEFRSKNKK
ncbi:glycoside hydrolase family 2 protein [Wenyingzhuangia sp. 2_MG-2023]|nr:sugar-binding domain-containing protein [Wenyingzhuangia sp. 2_MG-2023]MDO6738719.1 glycoside hydrolase family 2 TIM barrel-domain containing protein [Wenyingzhuangia sp. 2_MG-2023]MDO6803018.1 glycoside hydrolase family 2 TIM barrel-domain containing protein [Wenyingzhuangia sp. 1_MG-2023]